MVNLVEDVDYFVKVKTALMSVSDKSGLDVFVPGLLEINPELLILSTGGTYNKIKEIIEETGIGELEKNLQPVAVYTGQPETQGGLVKTLDFMIYLGLLTETYNAFHQEDLDRVKAVPIDLVAVNLYPFQNTVAKPDCTPEMARANIDIGGPTMLRAGAKNYHRVSAVVDPKDYNLVLSEMRDEGGYTTLPSRYDLKKKVFRHTRDYDTGICEYDDKTSAQQVIDAIPNVIMEKR